MIIHNISTQKSISSHRCRDFVHGGCGAVRDLPASISRNMHAGIRSPVSNWKPRSDTQTHNRVSDFRVLAGTNSSTLSRSEISPVPSAHDVSLAEDKTRAVGMMLGAMAGNVLGSAVQNDRHYQVVRRFPTARGLSDFWRFDISNEPIAHGCYTGDFSFLLAVARSLEAAGSSDAEGIALEIASLAVTEPGRRYPPYARLLLQTLTGPGLPLSAIPYLAEKFLDVNTSRRSHISGDRAEREPYGPADNGAAARILPLSLAYKDAPSEVLELAVSEACTFSHSHAIGMDGARVAAAAVVWLLLHRPRRSVEAPDLNTQEDDGPLSLLAHLRGIAQTEDMRGKLDLITQNIFQVEPVKDWRQMFCSSQWNRLVAVLSRITFHGYATSGTEGVAVALWALVTNWDAPEQAVIVSASFAGSAPVTSQMTGAFAGALHGDAWIPQRWMDELENGPGGRDEVIEMARRLASLRCGSVHLSSALN